MSHESHRPEQSDDAIRDPTAPALPSERPVGRQTPRHLVERLFLAAPGVRAGAPKRNLLLGLLYAVVGVLGLDAVRLVLGGTVTVC
jgi:hypothetical protein